MSMCHNPKGLLEGGETLLHLNRGFQDRNYISCPTYTPKRTMESSGGNLERMGPSWELSSRQRLLEGLWDGSLISCDDPAKASHGVPRSISNSDALPASLAHSQTLRPPKSISSPWVCDPQHVGKHHLPAQHFKWLLLWSTGFPPQVESSCIHHVPTASKSPQLPEAPKASHMKPMA